MQLSGLLRVVCGRSFCAIVTLCSGSRASGRMAWLHLERRLSAVLCLLLIRRKGWRRSLAPPTIMPEVRAQLVRAWVCVCVCVCMCVCAHARRRGCVGG